MPARKRIQGQQRRLRKYLHAQGGVDPVAREQELTATLARLDADLATLNASETDTVQSEGDTDTDTDADARVTFVASKAAQRQRLSQMRTDVASLLNVTRHIRETMAVDAA
jgi:capsule polysaccharide export protein KpsE/RkpR